MPCKHSSVSTKWSSTWLISRPQGFSSTSSFPQLKIKQTRSSVPVPSQNPSTDRSLLFLSPCPLCALTKTSRRARSRHRNDAAFLLSELRAACCWSPACLHRHWALSRCWSTAQLHLCFQFWSLAFLWGLPLVPSSDGPKTGTDLTSFLSPRQRNGRMLSVTPGSSNFAVETLLLLVNKQGGPHQRGRQLCVKARKQIWLLCLAELKTSRKWPLQPNYMKSTAPLDARRCHWQPRLPTLNSLLTKQDLLTKVKRSQANSWF